MDGQIMAELKPETPLYTIGVAARLLGLHQQTLRLYERLGLVNPARQSGRVRLYSQHDIEEIEYVVYLVRVKRINLAGVRLILEIVDDPEHSMNDIRKRHHFSDPKQE
jgi:MerR family transcriptional regulator/heat shock protein HspR